MANLSFQIFLIYLLTWAERSVANVEDHTSYLAPQAKGPDYTVADVWSKHKHLPTYEHLKTLVGDTFEFLPKAYDKKFKNPCWYDGKDLKCLPYFQILGVSKCGTTDFYHRLTYHEELVECSWKGPHFWDESSFPLPHRPNAKYNGSFRAYVGIFNSVTEHILQHPKSITGEASSNTFTAVKTYLRGHRRPKVLGDASLAQYLYEVTPFSRFIVLFRDPVERYFSAFHYYRPKRNVPRPSAEDFHKHAIRDIAIWKQCLERSGETMCAALYNPQQLVKGMYVLFMDEWIKVFGRDHFFFMRNEDYQAAPRPHVEAVMEFLGMSKLPEVQWSRMLGMKARNVQRKSGMLNETRALLQDFFRPYNMRLVATFNGDKRWAWGY